MTHNVLRIRYGFSALTALALVTACGSPAQTPATSHVAAPGTDPTNTVTHPEIASPSKAVDSAEIFEALGEQAFTATPDQLAILVDNASQTARGLVGLMPGDSSKELDGQMTAIREAVKRDERADIALSAVEAFKLVVTRFPPDTRIPLAISYLDYAGFRIQADLKSVPIRWEDADAAMAYAKEQWSVVESQVRNENLRMRFVNELAALDSALVERDALAASAAVIVELDSVDALESDFQSH
ncbi:hypothetical protein [Hyphomonas oceanitis]|uniref:hypothetical protein n=1 Tax=Hyphomonas oceanitis TaxID=81033 RepID=UPI0012EB6D9A|nr:hypothetical protein [Hyphomonas oceanitis]